MSLTYNNFSLDRMVSAVEKVRDRLLRATAALEKAGIDYAVAGGNAVAAHVTRVDEAAVRNTQDVDVLIRRTDLARVIPVLGSAGFVYRHVGGMDVFLDGPNAKVRDAVHLVFSGEKVRPHEALPNPEVTEFLNADGYRILTLEALVQIKLTAFRDKDRVHLRDLLEVGLLDETWVARFPAALAERLQTLIDTPEG
ncbi:MAG: hypothetical protein V4671_14665 [Armatimonadota bacterium]